MTAHLTDFNPATELAPDLPNEAPWLEFSFTETRRLRHDGWDGARMASFCAALAETGDAGKEPPPLGGRASAGRPEPLRHGDH